MEVSDKYKGSSGSAQQTRERTKIEFFSLEKGDNVYRIIPPIGSLAKKDIWSRYIGLEWGYVNSKGKKKCFQDIRVENKKTKMVEVESEAHLRRMRIESELDRLYAMLESGKITKEKYEQLAEKPRQDKNNYRLDKKVYLNVISLSGKIGLLKVPYKAKKALDTAIETLESKGVYPLSLENGRFFNFNRSGENRDTLYQVSVYQEEIDAGPEIGLVRKEKKHVITTEILNRLATEAVDLGKLDTTLYPKLSPEQVKTIVNGGPEDVDRVFKEFYDALKPVASEEAPEYDDYSSDEDVSETSSATPAKKS